MIAAGIAVPANDRHAIGRGGRRHALEHFGGFGHAVAPDGVHHGQRAATHGIDVADIDHHRAIAREPRLGIDEIPDHAFDRKQQVAIMVGNGGTIVAHRHRLPEIAHAARQRIAQRRQHAGDVGLVAKAAAGAQALHNLRDVHVPLLPSVDKPTRGVRHAG